MSFDDIPEDKAECYPCPVCDTGNFCEIKKAHWECDNCLYLLDKTKEENND